MNISRIAQIIFCFLLFGCNNDETNWEKTKLENTLNAYQSFIIENPESKYILDAQGKIYELEKDSIENMIHDEPLSHVELNGVLSYRFVNRIEYKDPLQEKQDSIEALPFKPRKETQGPIIYINENDTIWVIHTDQNTLSPEELHTSSLNNAESELTYKIYGNSLPRSVKNSSYYSLKMLDSISLLRSKIFNSINVHLLLKNDSDVSYKPWLIKNTSYYVQEAMGSRLNITGQVITFVQGHKKYILNCDSIQNLLFKYGNIKPDTYDTLYSLMLLNHEYTELLNYYKFKQDDKVNIDNKYVMSVFADSIVFTGSTKNILSLN